MTGTADIGYRGFITSRGIKFIALIAMTLSQFAMLATFIVKLMQVLSPDEIIAFPVGLLPWLTALGHITFPLLLIASFSSIFSNTETIVRSLIINASLALLTYIFCAFFLFGIVSNMVVELPEAMLKSIDINKLLSDIGENPQILSAFGLDITGYESTIPEIVSSISNLLQTTDINQLIAEYLPAISDTIAKFIITNFVNINVYWDLTLCTLFYFFLSYRPKKLRAGKLMLFRCLAVLPALYVIVSTFLNGLLKTSMINMPIWGIALLTNRKLSAYILFFMIVLLFKYKETEHLASGESYSSYLETLKTNRTSLQFSVYVCICIAILSLIDFAVSSNTSLQNWGLGTSYSMAMSIPVILLYSYSKKPKHRWPDAFIPIYYIINYGVLIIALLGMVVSLPQILELLSAG